MHVAYSSAFPAPDAAADDDGDADADAPATPGPLEPLEHPAASTPAPTSTTASKPARRILDLRLTAEAIAGIPDISLSLNQN
jgi:hypothetical protein